MIVEGILPIWKEAGCTSHDVVASVRKILNIRRIGHSGTLDPQVEGVLPLCIGRATRLIEYLQDTPKAYTATLLIGISSDTQDLQGEWTDKKSTVDIDEKSVYDIIHSFQGNIEQLPPMYSALKVNGKRLYELAREGIEVERKLRPVTIYQIDIISISHMVETTEVEFNVVCSKGTYIRTLCEDIGKKLGYPALMKTLIRTSSGGISTDQCISIAQLKELHQLEQIEKYILPMDFAMQHHAQLILNETQTIDLFHGKPVLYSNPIICDNLNENELLRVYDSSLQFLGVVRWDSSSKYLIAVKLFVR